MSVFFVAELHARNIILSTSFYHIIYVYMQSKLIPSFCEYVRTCTSFDLSLPPKSLKFEIAI